MAVYSYLLNVVKEKGAGYLALLDPDRLDDNRIVRLASQCAEGGADGLLIGSSLLLSTTFDEIVAKIKKNVNIPVVIFPGGPSQVSSHADAILFLSLISGRNPYHLIGDQVRAAPVIKEFGIEPISTGYMLIESGQATSIEFMSNTRPIPRDKPDIAMAHALAAEYLGMKMVYLEAGSGAMYPVSDEMIAAVRDYVSIPIVVGGGIRDSEVALRKVKAGASFVVTGNILEKEENSLGLITEFSATIHWKKRQDP